MFRMKYLAISAFSVFESHLYGRAHPKSFMQNRNRAPHNRPAHVITGRRNPGDSLDLFCAFLGTAAGNLALTLGARGGVYVGGGIVPRLGERFDRSPFRARFEDKGRFAGYLAAVPVFVIRTPTSPALLGASRALRAPQ